MPLEDGGALLFLNIKDANRLVARRGCLGLRVSESMLEGPNKNYIPSGNHLVKMRYQKQHCRGSSFRGKLFLWGVS